MFARGFILKQPFSSILDREDFPLMKNDKSEILKLLYLVSYRLDFEVCVLIKGTGSLSGCYGIDGR